MEEEGVMVHSKGWMSSCQLIGHMIRIRATPIIRQSSCHLRGHVVGLRVTSTIKRLNPISCLIGTRPVPISIHMTDQERLLITPLRVSGHMTNHMTVIPDY